MSQPGQGTIQPMTKGNRYERFASTDKWVSWLLDLTLQFKVSGNEWGKLQMESVYDWWIDIKAVILL